MEQSIFRIVKAHPQDTWPGRLGKTAKGASSQGKGLLPANCLIQRLRQKSDSFSWHIPEKL
jgi:hypothetical protein